MNEQLKECSIRPIEAMNIISNLKSQLSGIVHTRNTYRLEEIFDYDQTGEQKQEKIELMDEFLDNALILIENNEQIQITLMFVIASLTIVPYDQFGKKCLDLLCDLITSGKRMANFVQKVLKQDVIKYITKEDDIRKIPHYLMQGVIKILEENDEFQIFESTIFGKVKAWLKQVKKLLNEQQAHGMNVDVDKQKQNEKIINIQLKLISLTIASFKPGKDDSFSRADLLIKEYDIINEVIEIISKQINPNSDKERQIDLLKIVQATCDDEEIRKAEVYQKMNLIKILSSEIRHIAQFYATN